jgi:uncharacterized repeat protein (TIGR02543 family)
LPDDTHTGSSKTWTVRFNSNGGSSVLPIEYVKNGAIIRKPGNPQKPGFTFDAWYTDSVTLQNMWNFSESRVISDTLLHAGWEVRQEGDIEYNNLNGLKRDCADPYVLKYDGKYYLYGTGGNDGIKVYQSDNLAEWSGAVGNANGYALHKNDVWGEKWFWAPEVYLIDEVFYMFYSAEEHIAVATSNSPLGPFKQAENDRKPFHSDIKEIDSHLFIDDNGKKYLYFVRFTNGNEIWGAELNDNLRSIKESTLKRCIGASTGLQEWEKSPLSPQANAKVNEGPFMLKHKGVYYLTYSANHYENPNYGVGYATSSSPLGTFVKYNANPILTKNNQTQGVGHHSFVTVKENCQYAVYHSHNNMTSINPRKTVIDYYEFIPSGSGSTDILKIYGPTTTPQLLCP